MLEESPHFAATLPALAPQGVPVDIQRIIAEHEKGYRDTSDEVWNRNPICTKCNRPWPCDTVKVSAALSLRSEATEGSEYDRAMAALAVLLGKDFSGYVAQDRGGYMHWSTVKPKWDDAADGELDMGDGAWLSLDNKIKFPKVHGTSLMNSVRRIVSGRVSPATDGTKGGEDAKN